jgi:BlaI family transcriptional regulator, penicillinase repressor
MTRSCHCVVTMTGAQTSRSVSAKSAIFAIVSRDAAQRGLVDDLLAMFGGKSRPVVAHLIGTGKLTLEDVEYAEKTVKELKKGGKI